MVIVNQLRGIAMLCFGIGICIWAIVGGPAGWPVAKTLTLGIGLLLLGTGGPLRFLFAADNRAALILFGSGMMVSGLHLVLWPRDVVARAFGVVMICAGLLLMIFRQRLRLGPPRSGGRR